MKKWLTGALWAVMLTALSAVTAFADLIFPELQQPSPTPTPVPTPTPLPDPTPVPLPAPARIDPTLLTVLIIGVVVVAASVIAWVVIRRRNVRAQ